MTIDLASVAPEDLQPIADMMLAMPEEKRGEIPLRVQRAAREFLHKSVDAQRVAAELETDPVRKAVYGALAKQLPAPAPTLDPLKREALGTLVKAVTAGAKASGLEKGLLGTAARAVGHAVAAPTKFGVRAGASVGARIGAKRALRHAHNTKISTKEAVLRGNRTLTRSAAVGAAVGGVAGAAATVEGLGFAYRNTFGRRKKKAEG